MRRPGRRDDFRLRGHPGHHHRLSGDRQRVRWYRQRRGLPDQRITPGGVRHVGDAPAARADRRHPRRGSRRSVDCRRRHPDRHHDRRRALRRCGGRAERLRTQQPGDGGGRHHGGHRLRRLGPGGAVQHRCCSRAGSRGRVNAYRGDSRPEHRLHRPRYTELRLRLELGRGRAVQLHRRQELQADPSWRLDRQRGDPEPHGPDAVRGDAGVLRGVAQRRHRGPIERQVLERDRGY